MESEEEEEEEEEEEKAEEEDEEEEIKGAFKPISICILFFINH